MPRIKIIAMFALLLCLGGILRPAKLLAQEVAEPDPNLFRQDFRGGQMDERFLAYFPGPMKDEMQLEPAGLHIQLGLLPMARQATGVETRFRVRGDFAITASFELLRAETPTKGFGAGATLFLITDTPSADRIKFACSYRPKGQYYICQLVTPAAEKKQQQIFVPTAVRKGKLQLVRRGGVVTFLAMEEGEPEFRLLHELELGPHDLQTVRWVAECDRTDVPLDVRLEDLAIRAPDMRRLAGLPADAPELARAAPPPRRTALVVAGLLGLGLGGLWLCLRGMQRYRRRPRDKG